MLSCVSSLLPVGAPGGSDDGDDDIDGVMLYFSKKHTGNEVLLGMTEIHWFPRSVSGSWIIFKKSWVLFSTDVPKSLSTAKEFQVSLCFLGGRMQAWWYSTANHVEDYCCRTGKSSRNVPFSSAGDADLHLDVLFPFFLSSPWVKRSPGKLAGGKTKRQSRKMGFIVALIFPLRKLPYECWSMFVDWKFLASLS